MKTTVMAVIFIILSPRPPKKKSFKNILNQKNKLIKYTMWTFMKRKPEQLYYYNYRADLKAKKFIVDKQEHHIMIKDQFFKT